MDVLQHAAPATLARPSPMWFYDLQLFPAHGTPAGICADSGHFSSPPAGVQLLFIVFLRLLFSAGFPGPACSLLLPPPPRFCGAFSSAWTCCLLSSPTGVTERFPTTRRAGRTTSHTSSSSSSMTRSVVTPPSLHARRGQPLRLD